jgi:WD40 repeat protein
MLAQTGRITSVALNGASNRIATGGADGVVRVYDVQGRLLDTIHSGVRTVERVAFSPDGTKLAVASADTVARLWTLDPVRPGPILRGHRAAVTSARFSSDGRLVVTSSLDHDARIWDAETGRLLRVLRGHFARVSDATFSPDGRWVVTAGPGAAGLWRVDNGSLALFLRGHAKPLTSAWFLPKGIILTASEDGTIRKYRCEICGGLDELLAAATSHIARLNAPLTPAQRRAVFP